MRFERLAVIGVGLIGGSFALATRARGLVGRVVGCARSEGTRTAALECGVADEVTDDPAFAVAGADLVYISAPVGAMEPLMAAIAPALSPSTLVTDAGSTKERVVELATQHLAGRCVFIPGHPMAGSEQAGPGAARADLFDGKPYILTPLTSTPTGELQRLRDLLRAIGAHVILAEASQHDRLVAATSHLPHLVAAALSGALSDLAARAGDIHPFTGTGVRDATRIAKGPPEVWRDILLDNRENVKAALRAFSDEIGHYLAAMESDDAELLTRLLEKARTFRRGLDES
jgi:prephenate dehydrogenase